VSGVTSVIGDRSQIAGYPLTQIAQLLPSCLAGPDRVAAATAAPVRLLTDTSTVGTQDPVCAALPPHVNPDKRKASPMDNLSARNTSKTSLDTARPLTDTEIDATAGGFLWIPVVVIPFWIGAKIRLAIDPKAGD